MLSLQLCVSRHQLYLLFTDLSLLVWRFHVTLLCFCLATRWSQSSRFTVSNTQSVCSVGFFFFYCVSAVCCCNVVSAFWCDCVCVWSCRWNKIFKSRIVQTIALYGNTYFMVAMAILVFLLIGACVCACVRACVCVSVKGVLSSWAFSRLSQSHSLRNKYI